MIIHIGTHKTATTFLQQEVFPLIDRNIVSNEMFSGDPTNPRNNSKTRYSIARTLHKIKPDATILLCFRESEDWKDSLYRHYIRSGSTMNRVDYERIFDKGWLDYDRYVKYLNKLFPKVLVFQYSKHTFRMVADMCRVLEVPIPNYRDKQVNVGYTNKQVKTALLLNKTFKRNASKRFSARWIMKWISKIRREG